MNLIELVPHNYEALESQAKKIVNDFDFIQGVNIPDVIRLEIRSYEAVSKLLQFNITGIPHIRAIDKTVENTVEVIMTLVDQGLKHVLIISGDPPHDDRETFDVTPIDIAKKLTSTCPNLRVYGALDPYRQSMEDEIFYARQKIEAGMTGLFTQPFFDIELTETYLKELSDLSLFIGVSPVTSEKSYNYWVTRNKVTFPETFSIEYEDNCKLGSEIIKLSNTYNQHSYLMPIKEDPYKYCNSINNYF